MSCPNCSQPLKEQTLDSQSVMHCVNCGGSFFEANGINRISIESAQKLADEKMTDEVVGNKKVCPKDNGTLAQLTSDSIPQNVLLLQCDTCKGVFAYPDDLVNFKKAQSAKIEFFHLWGKPLPALGAVLVFVFVGAVSFSLFANYLFLKQPNLNAIQAENLVTGFRATSSERYVLIRFNTNTPLLSSMKIFNVETGEKIEITTAQNPSTIHFLTTSALDARQSYLYEIILTDDKGKEKTTKAEKLMIER